MKNLRKLYRQEAAVEGTEFVNENYVIYADSTLFNVFTIPLVAGEGKTALNAPGTMVISESAARKYFGSTDVVGKALETDDKKLHKITAVMKDLPHNSHFKADFIWPMLDADYEWGSYLSHNLYTYLLLRPGTDYKAFEKNFPQVIDKYVLPQAQQLMKVPSMGLQQDQPNQ